MSRDVELGVQKLIDVDLDSESEVEEPAHFGLARGKPIGREAGPLFHGYRGFLSLSGRSLLANRSSRGSPNG